MRIKKIHIEQFGGLSDLNWTFSEGLNRICQENGWGKTTLTVFIRAMLYGFPSKGERSGDREKYRPWGNGIYGGSLTFTVEEHPYTVFRTFGASRSGRSDEFRLIDEETRQESSRWGQELGEALFGINEESFTNTAWIRQDGCTVTGDMTSRLGGQTGILEDMKQYEQVMAEMEKHLNHLSPKRKTGLIFRKMMERQELEAEILRLPVLEQKIQSLEQETEEERRRLKVLFEKQEELHQLQQEYSRQQEYRSVREIHDALQREYLSRDEIWEQHQQKFPDGIPEEEEEAVVLREQSLDEQTSSGRARPVLSSAGILLLAAGCLAAVFSAAAAILLLTAGVFVSGLGLWKLFREKKGGGVNGRKSGTARNDRGREQEELRQLLIRQREAEAARIAWRELQKAAADLRGFYERYPWYEEASEGGISENLREYRSMTELSGQLRELHTGIRETENRIRDLDHRREQQIEERDRLTEREERLDCLREELVRLEKDHRITELTAGFLREARDTCASKYMEGIQRAFLSWYRMIDPEQKEPLYIDSAYRICTMGGGIPRTEEVLSRGYQDLAAFCLRLALLDAMYDKEPPCIIMDDPFICFDERKQERAMEFLRQISEKYQIIYFSCREPAGSFSCETKESRV